MPSALAPGSKSLSKAIRFDPISPEISVTPVTLLPGRFKL
jgi:hypothetical protein